MSLQYLENPFLFINSTDASVPKGRNVRTQSRSQQANGPSRDQGGHFGLLNLKVKRHDSSDESGTARKRRKRVFEPKHRASVSGSLRLDLDITLAPPNYTNSENSLNPSEVLTVATFHIRRLAAMTVLAQPNRLGEVLRCRQWACVPFALERFGKGSRCLDSALFCIAAKLNQITGGQTSSLDVLSSYTEALQELQAALQNPIGYSHADLLATTQLLAVYEMLDSFDNETWTKHVAGAASLAQPRAATSSGGTTENVLTFTQAAPMFTDALLTGNDEFFRRYPWRAFRQSFHRTKFDLPESCRGLVFCLLEIPELLDASSSVQDLDLPARYVILDRAHVLKARLRNGLLQSHVNSHHDNHPLESFDQLGMSLAALVALDRLIASLRPVEKRSRETDEDKTSELCAQLLQLELGAAEAYPASDLMAAFQMSTFQQQAGFVIVLPGSGER